MKFPFSAPSPIFKAICFVCLPLFLPVIVLSSFLFDCLSIIFIFFLTSAFFRKEYNCVMKYMAESHAEIGSFYIGLQVSKSFFVLLSYLQKS